MVSRDLLEGVLSAGGTGGLGPGKTQPKLPDQDAGGPQSKLPEDEGRNAGGPPSKLPDEGPNHGGGPQSTPTIPTAPTAPTPDRHADKSKAGRASEDGVVSERRQGSEEGSFPHSSTSSDVGGSSAADTGTVPVSAGAEDPHQDRDSEDSAAGEQLSKSSPAAAPPTPLHYVADTPAVCWRLKRTACHAFLRDSSRLEVFENVETLRTVPLFAYASAHTLRKLGELAERRFFPPGDAILLKGAGVNALHVLVDGAVLDHTAGDRVVFQQRGQFFGGLCLLGRRFSRSTSTLVSAGCTVLRLRRKMVARSFGSFGKLLEEGQGPPQGGGGGTTALDDYLHERKSVGGLAKQENRAGGGVGPEELS